MCLDYNYISQADKLKGRDKDIFKEKNGTNNLNLQTTTEVSKSNRYLSREKLMLFLSQGKIIKHSGGLTAMRKDRKNVDNGSVRKREQNTFLRNMIMAIILFVGLAVNCIVGLCRIYLDRADRRKQS